MDTLTEKKKIIVFGAGVAGLSVAHELSKWGHEVDVHEILSEPGGFYRSERNQEDFMPNEYSWHGMGPWYHNTFDIMKEISFQGNRSIFEEGLSRPIDFGIFPNEGDANFYRGFFTIPLMFNLSLIEFIKSSWLMLKTWSSNLRSEQNYAMILAAKAWKPLMSQKAHQRWRASFGPWIGSDWTKVSLHTAGQFFRKQLFTKPPHLHPADSEGPGWMHGQRDGWLVLKGPSNEIWFSRWLDDLERRGVKFHWKSGLKKLNFQSGKISEAELINESLIEADAYIVAINPFSAARIFSLTPELEKMKELSLFQNLIQDGPHVQVSFRIAFAEKIQFPEKRTGIVISDSEFNLTLFAQESAWSEDISLGQGVKSLWTGTSCIGTVPGQLFGLPLVRCTKEQFIEEVKAQIFSCGSLDKKIRDANGGKSLKDFRIMKIEVWHEWEFLSEGIATKQPKWVNSIHTQKFQPGQITGAPNLFLAGAHTKTQADVWSIEGAVESGRRAAKAIDSRVQVLDQYKPKFLTLLSVVDDVFYKFYLPHVLDIVFILVSVTLLILVISSL